MWTGFTFDHSEMLRLSWAVNIKIIKQNILKAVCMPTPGPSVAVYLIASWSLSSELKGLETSRPELSHNWWSLESEIVLWSSHAHYDWTWSHVQTVLDGYPALTHFDHPEYTADVLFRYLIWFLLKVHFEIEMKMIYFKLAETRGGSDVFGFVWIQRKCFIHFLLTKNGKNRIDGLQLHRQTSDQSLFLHWRINEPLYSILAGRLTVLACGWDLCRSSLRYCSAVLFVVRKWPVTKKTKTEIILVNNCLLYI